MKRLAKHFANRLAIMLAGVLFATLLGQGAWAMAPSQRDVAYGDDEEQRFDVFAPARAQGAPVLMMVHGGGWERGDKEMGRVVESKVARWVPKGFVFITVNYRLQPKSAPLEQARDVARALAAAQKRAFQWGADPQRFILIGHSAGAHLVALLNARPELAEEQGARPWLGSVLLDSGALDVPAIMNTRHFRLYDRAFGHDPAYWQSVSPYHQIRRASAPLLAVCSGRRANACPEARRFVAKASGLGTTASVLATDLTHGEINARLGEESEYTAAVEAFMRGLDRGIAQALR